MDQVNFDDATHCSPTGPPLPTFGELDPSIGTGDELWEVIDDGGLGAPVVTQPVADSPTALDTNPRVAAPSDDQNQDRDAKKGKHGKKGGKGRKK